MTDRFSVCPACASTEIAARRGFTEKHLYACATCGLTFDERIPTQTELEEYYRQYSYGSLKPCPEATKSSFRRLLGEFEAWRENGRILDIGCGQGDFLVSALESGWSAFGHEFSESAATLCKARGIDMASGPLSQETFPGGAFDVITAFEVIEHINAPNDFFRAAHALLRRGGLFYCTTPNFNAILRHIEGADFKMVVYPEHLIFYTAKSLRQLAVEHGFVPIQIRTTGIDIARLKTAFASKQAPRAHHECDDLVGRRAVNDAFRASVGKSLVLTIGKELVNSALSLTQTGDTLKGYFLKA